MSQRHPLSRYFRQNSKITAGILVAAVVAAASIEAKTSYLSDVGKITSQKFFVYASVEACMAKPQANENKDHPQSGCAYEQRFRDLYAWLPGTRRHYASQAACEATYVCDKDSSFPFIDTFSTNYHPRKIGWAVSAEDPNCVVPVFQSRILGEGILPDGTTAPLKPAPVPLFVPG